MKYNQIKYKASKLAYRGKSVEDWRTEYENEKPTRDTSMEDDLDFLQNHKSWIDNQFEYEYQEPDRDLD